jgi:hypothetical protein
MREAVQQLSKPEHRVRYAHTGWRKIGGKWMYLHAGGAIGATEPIEVSLFGKLQNFALPKPPTGDERIQAVKTAIEFLDIARPEIMTPLFCAIWNSVLGFSPINVGIFGKTSAGKTALAAVMQQHFGAGFRGGRSPILPGDWSSTVNYNERLAFIVKDGLAVFDEYKPNGSKANRMQLEQHETGSYKTKLTACQRSCEIPPSRSRRRREHERSTRRGSFSVDRNRVGGSSGEQCLRRGRGRRCFSTRVLLWWDQCGPM